MDRRGIDLRAFLSGTDTDEELRRVIAHLADSASYIRLGIQRGKRGKLDTENVYDEKQMELDVWADREIAKRLEHETSFGVLEIASEEQGEIRSINNRGGRSGSYSVTVDPLDGSSLIDVNFSIGTIFGLYKGKILDGKCARDKMAAAMYVLYGPNTTMVLSSGKGTHEFLLDEAGKWILEREDIKMEAKGKICSTGEFRRKWTPQHLAYIERLEDEEGEGYKLRYSGALVADVNQILMKGGGIFTYPGSVKKPQGKLRLLFELQPMAFLTERAGGRATNGLENILDIVPERLDQRSPIYIGSEYEVNMAAEYLGRAA